MDVIEKTKLAMEDFFLHETTGHDWHHVERVYRNAMAIASAYPQVDRDHVALAALLHDRYDHKLVEDEKQSKAWVENWLLSLGLTPDKARAILYTIDAVGFKKGQNNLVPKSLEDKIVQDADRLDAIGAIGIARTFAYSGAKDRPIYLGEEPGLAQGPDTAIQHFYDKLLHLKDLLHTDKAKEIAQGRHEFMETYLGQFYDEWAGKK